MLRLLRFFAVVLLLAAPAAALAQGNRPDGAGQGQGNSNGNGQGNGNANGQNNGNGPGQNNGNGPGPGNGNANGQGNGPEDGGGAPTAAVEALGEAAIRDAVAKKRALPLEAITARVAEVSAGRILDLQLLSVGGILVYDATVIEADGLVRRLYFYAQSGLPVVPR